MTSLSPRARTVSLALGVAIAAGGTAAWMIRRPTAPPVVLDLPASEDAGVIAWCAPGLEPIAGGGCFAPARVPTSSPQLIVYLHGRYERSATADEMDRQRRLAERATAHGYSVLALRGQVGECITSPELATWYCWPSNEHTAHDAASFVEGWKSALGAVERRIGPGIKRFVLGFSNGAFFAGLLAVGGYFDATAFAIANGGTVEPVHPARGKPPVLLLSADSDESQAGMIQFDTELTREGWPHEVYARAGGHALLDQDIDAVVTFFTRCQREALPLSPPLTTHRPQPHLAAAVTTPKSAIDDDAGPAVPAVSDED
jgi:predicted esterase